MRLTAEEIEVLPDLVAARLCQSIAIGAWRATLHPENTEYILAGAEPARRALQTMMALDRAALFDGVFMGSGQSSSSNLLCGLMSAPPDAQHHASHRCATFLPWPTSFRLSRSAASRSTPTAAVAPQWRRRAS